MRVMVIFGDVPYNGEIPAHTVNLTHLISFPIKFLEEYLHRQCQASIFHEVIAIF